MAEYTALFAEHRAPRTLLAECMLTIRMSFPGVCIRQERALFAEYRALFAEYRALFAEYRALFSECKALLVECRTPRALFAEYGLTILMSMRWLRLVGSLKSQVSFAKDLYERDDILQKGPMKETIFCKRDI